MFSADKPDLNNFISLALQTLGVTGILVIAHRAFLYDTTVPKKVEEKPSHHVRGSRSPPTQYKYSLATKTVGVCLFRNFEFEFSKSYL